MIKFVLSLLIVSSGHFHSVRQEFPTAHDCADAGIAFVSQPKPEWEGERIAFSCEPIFTPVRPL